MSQPYPPLNDSYHHSYQQVQNYHLQGNPQQLPTSQQYSNSSLPPSALPHNQIMAQQTDTIQNPSFADLISEERQHD